MTPMRYQRLALRSLLSVRYQLVKLRDVKTMNREGAFSIDLCAVVQSAGQCSKVGERVWQ